MCRSFATAVSVWKDLTRLSEILRHLQMRLKGAPFLDRAASDGTERIGKPGTLHLRSHCAIVDNPPEGLVSWYPYGQPQILAL